MTDSVAPNELLARYIVSSKWLHKKDQTVKQDAFMPQESSLELSVTRHLNFSEEDIWEVGKRVASKISRVLHGRADVETVHILAQGLLVVPQLQDDNPNHANIVDWPIDKFLRKACALEIARAAHFIANPEGKTPLSVET